jgi:hypothetical protein
MAGLLNAASVLMCPHGGTVTASTSNTRARAAGGFILRARDTFTIAGCPLNVSGAPHPCVRVQWVVASPRTRVMSDAALTAESVGLCLAADGAPQGTAQVVTTQPRVTGS